MESENITIRSEPGCSHWITSSDSQNSPNSSQDTLTEENIVVDDCNDESRDSISLTQTSSVDSSSNIVIKDEKTDTDDDNETSIKCGEHELFFESDHPALKMNSDYRKVLYTVILLEDLRLQAIKDLDKLHECKEKALADPIGFVKKLQNGVDLGIPTPQKIPEIPSVDWAKYTITDVDMSFSKQKLTRQSIKAAGDVFGKLSKPVIRGKGKLCSEQGKASKFPIPWSAEEQKKLEALLIEHPPEEIESRRWAKIANALGNRTTTQVASRVQKYFIKLLKAGMPIPGRQPSSTYLRKPRRQVIRSQPSTFWASHTPPVLITEGEEETFCSSNKFPRHASDEETCVDLDLSDEEMLDTEIRNSSEYQELLCIKQALNEKQSSLGLSQHIGYKCAHCEFEPIIGIRWHCTDCPPSQPIDFCDDCANSNREVKAHLSSHHLEPIRQSSSATVDKDYIYFASNDHGYLDPNYISAT